MRTRAILAAPVGCIALVLSACTSLTGLDGGSNYSCKAPEGVTCDSVAGVYANAVGHNLPGQRRGIQGPAAGTPDAPEFASSRRTVTAANPPTPAALRSSPRILRLWFKPWEDADHDLYDQGYVYVQVDAGQWQVDHVHRQVRAGYLPLKAPPRAAAATADAQAAPRAAPGLPRPGGTSPSATRQNATESDE
jgi:conjugal transfer pilus assembly protein TraV